MTRSRSADGRGADGPATRTGPRRRSDGSDAFRNLRVAFASRSQAAKQTLEKDEGDLSKLLEVPPLRETRSRLSRVSSRADEAGAQPASAANGHGAEARDADREQEDEELEEPESESESDADDYSPAWSRGRRTGSALKRKATRAAGREQEDGDEVVDVQEDAPELRVTRPRPLRRGSPGSATRASRLRPSGSQAAPANGQGEPEASETEEEAEPPAGEGAAQTSAGKRYPERLRATVDLYDPSKVAQQPQTAGGRRTRSDSDEEGSSGEDRPAHRYPLRERARTGLQATPPKEPDRLRGGQLPKGRRLGFGGRRGSRRAPRFHVPTDDLADCEQGLDADWAALQAGQRGHGSGGGGGGGDASARRLQPWEAALRDAGALRSPAAAGASKTQEITPMQVDASVTFDQVGGLEQYVRALKEMVFLPLVYPELFERFRITPPRGVLFYGPPGTGKTLVARALAAQASRAGRRVAFFMRKGADVLSKWVGEAERQLRLLFEEAQRQQPAIIFFDEIDGLAPVRSSKQDQIHNSIVSTLLALMDGLDSRGQVVVIGATNRIDALDGALRRPGRFDRELVFPLPNLAARSAILDIHTRAWAAPPAGELRAELADMCVGYCGADLKALCTEASLRALRRSFPQIYESEAKLALDPARVSVGRQDWLAAFQAIVPASHRSAAAPARPLPALVVPVLRPRLEALLRELRSRFPPAACVRAAAGPGQAAAAAADSDDEDEAGALLAPSGGGALVSRPRLLVCGPEGAGQAHLGPALLYALEGLPVHAIGLPALLSDAGARSPEEAVVHAVVEARRATPAILFLPHLGLWWDTAPPSLRTTLRMLLADLPPDLPLLLAATADAPLGELPLEALQLFGGDACRCELSPPDRAQRAAMFAPLAAAAAGAPEQRPAREAAPPPPPLPVAEDAAAVAGERAAAEAARAWEADEAALRALRMGLRDVATRLLCARQFKDFWEAVDPEDDPEYYARVSSAMDLGTILCRVDGRQYPTAAHFLADVALIPQAAAQDWGDDPAGIPEVSRARALEDQTREAVQRRLPAELRARCEAIHAAGGLPPPPPGVLVPTGQPLQLPPPAGDKQAGRSETAGEARGSRRLRGDEVADAVIFQDPEAIMRAQRQARRKPKSAPPSPQPAAEAQAAAAEAAAGGSRPASAAPSEGATGEQQRTAEQANGAATDASETAAAAEPGQATGRGGEAGDFRAAFANFGNALRRPSASPEPEQRPKRPRPASEAAAAADLLQGSNVTPAAGEERSAKVLRVTSRDNLPPGGQAATQAKPGPCAEPEPETGRGNGPAAEAAGPSGMEPAGEQAHANGEPQTRSAGLSPQAAAQERLAAAMADATEGMLLDALESLHCKLARVVHRQRYSQNRQAMAAALLQALREATGSC